MPGTPYDFSVFINCPFDLLYQPLFRAIVFTVQDCGYIPRCALESDNAAVTRIEKIYNIVEECKYAIHDISRTQLDPKFKLPRFNMPLELGIFLGARQYGSVKQKRKECLIIDKGRYRFMKFCSDISGQDVRAHKNTIKRIVRVTRDWFRNLNPTVTMPGADRMLKRYFVFKRALPIICNTHTPRLDANKLAFNDYTYVVAQWLKANP